ncbi:MAG: hypothetical protein WDW36_006383 [Sanguina aurantia]
MEELEEIWQVEDKEDREDAILSASKVITESQQRLTYQQMAAGHSIIATTLPKINNPGIPSKASPTVHHSPGQWPPVKSSNSNLAEAGTDGGGYGGNGSSSGGRAGGAQSRQQQQQGASSGQQLSARLERVLDEVESRRSVWEGAMLEAATAAELARALEEEVRAGSPGSPTPSASPTHHPGVAPPAARLRAGRWKSSSRPCCAPAPPAPERLRKVQRWLVQRIAALPRSEVVAQAKQLAMLMAESELRAVEGELEFLAEAREGLEVAEAAQFAAQSEVAAALAQREALAATGYRRVLEREAQRRAASEGAQAEMRQGKVRAAEEGRERGRERLAERHAHAAATLARGQAATAAGNAARRGAVLALKESLGAVRREVAEKATLYRQLHKQRSEVHEREFQALLEQGINPYEVFRTRENQAIVAHRRQDIREHITARQTDIALRLAMEQGRRVREEEAASMARDARDRFTRDMSVDARDAKVEAYLRGATKGGITMLDAAVPPSQAMTLKTRAFGLGKAEPQLLLQLTERHPGATPKELLLPVKFRTPPAPLDPGGRGGEDGHEGADDQGPPVPPSSRGSGGSSGAAGWRGNLETRGLTKLEQNIMEAAKLRHKKSIGAPKVAMGREPGSSSFMTTPSLVVFKDFEVGKSYSRKVAITNTSYLKNTYRVLDVPVEYGNVLEVGYTLPGYLAAGVSGEVTLTFTPKANEDIETQVNLLGESGPFVIPVRCLSKKALMGVSSAEVGFGAGGVTLGESTVRNLVLSNRGALEVEYRLEGEDEAAVQETTVTRDGAPYTYLSGCGFQVGPVTGCVGGYTKVTLAAVFMPREAKPARLPLRVTFKSTAHRTLVVPPLGVSLVGLGRDVPVFVERNVVDLRCCLMGHVYRDFLMVQNGGKSAMKLQVVSRPELEGVFEFSPDFGFVQGGESFPVNILFKPQQSVFERCSRFVVDAEAGILEVPMRIHVPDQRLPVDFMIRAQVTSSDLAFEPPSSLGFGCSCARSGFRRMRRSPVSCVQVTSSDLVFEPPSSLGFGCSCARSGFRRMRRSAVSCVQVTSSDLVFEPPSSLGFGCSCARSGFGHKRRSPVSCVQVTSSDLVFEPPSSLGFGCSCARSGFRRMRRSAVSCVQVTSSDLVFEPPSSLGFGCSCARSGFGHKRRSPVSCVQVTSSDLVFEPPSSLGFGCSCARSGFRRMRRSAVSCVQFTSSDLVFEPPSSLGFGCSCARSGFRRMRRSAVSCVQVTSSDLVFEPPSSLGFGCSCARSGFRRMRRSAVSCVQVTSSDLVFEPPSSLGFGCSCARSGFRRMRRSAVSCVQVTSSDLVFEPPSSLGFGCSCARSGFGHKRRSPVSCVQVTSSDLVFEPPSSLGFGCSCARSGFRRMRRSAVSCVQVTSSDLVFEPPSSLGLGCSCARSGFRRMRRSAVSCVQVTSSDLVFEPPSSLGFGCSCARSGFRHKRRSAVSCVQVTSSDLVFEPPALDFGPCVMAEQTGVLLRITNRSLLPQSFGFLGMHPGVEMKPNDGFGYALPGETVERVVSYQPSIPGPQKFVLSCKSLAARSFLLPCKATGIQPGMSLSHNKIRFPATPLNDTSTVSVNLVNSTDHSQAYEFDVPLGAGLLISPHVGEVPPRSALRVQIDFTPRPGDDEEGFETVEGAEAERGVHYEAEAEAEAGPASPPRPTSPGMEAMRGILEVRRQPPPLSGVTCTTVPMLCATSEWALSPSRKTDPARRARRRATAPESPRGPGGRIQIQGSRTSLPLDSGGGTTFPSPAAPAPPPWYRWARHSLTCYLRPPAPGSSHSALGSTAGSAVAPGRAFAAAGVEEGGGGRWCCAAAAPERDNVPGKDCAEVDFGPVPVGQRVLRTLEVMNQGLTPAQLYATPLDTREAFSVVNSMRVVQPGGATFKVLLAFAPHQKAQCLEMLTLREGKGEDRTGGEARGVGNSSVSVASLEPRFVMHTGAPIEDPGIGPRAGRTGTEPQSGWEPSHPDSFPPPLPSLPAPPPLSRPCPLPPPSPHLSLPAPPSSRPSPLPPPSPSSPPTSPLPPPVPSLPRTPKRSSDKTRIRVVLKGAGIAPELQLSPEGVTTKGLDLGDVLLGESSEATLTVHNVCPFPLTFGTAVRHGVAGDPNLPMKPPFYCRPQGGTLAQGESQVLTVVFQPSSQRPYFEDVLHVTVPNQQEELAVPLRGRCWEEGVFIAGPTYPTPSDDPFCEAKLHTLLPPLPPHGTPTCPGPADPSSSQDHAAAAAAPGSKKPSSGGAAAASGKGGAADKGPVTPLKEEKAAAVIRTLTMTFPEPVYLGESCKGGLEVGNLKSQGLGGAAGEVVFDELPAAAKEAGWVLDPVRQSLLPGEKKPITLRYTAPAVAHAGMAAYFGHPEHVSVTLGALLKGGLPAPPSPGGRRVTLVARVLLLPGARAAPLSAAAEDGAGAPPGEGGGSPPPPTVKKGMLGKK